MQNAEGRLASRTGCVYTLKTVLLYRIKPLILDVTSFSWLPSISSAVVAFNQTCFGYAYTVTGVCTYCCSIFVLNGAERGCLLCEFSFSMMIFRWIVRECICVYIVHPVVFLRPVPRVLRWWNIIYIYIVEVILGLPQIKFDWLWRTLDGI